MGCSAVPATGADFPSFAYTPWVAAYTMLTHMLTSTNLFRQKQSIGYSCAQTTTKKRLSRPIWSPWTMLEACAPQPDSLRLLMPSRSCRSCRLRSCCADNIRLVAGTCILLPGSRRLLNPPLLLLIMLVVIAFCCMPVR